MDTLKLPYAGDLHNRQQLADTLHTRPGPVLALTGHLHIRAHAIDRNILQLTHAALVEHPHEATIVEVTHEGETLTVARYALTVTSAPPPDNPNQPAGTIDPPRGSWCWADDQWAPDGPHRQPPTSSGENCG